MMYNDICMTVKEMIALEEQKIKCDICICDNLKKIRISHGYSQDKLCAELQRRGCGIGRTTYAKYEYGELNVRISVLRQLKAIYDCNYNDFFEGID